MAAADSAPPRRPARAQRKRLAIAIGSGLATAAILLLLDGALAGRALVGGLTRARSELNVGIEAIVTGDPEGARSHLRAAVDAADRAAGAVGHPSLELAGLLPIAGENLDAAAGVAAASRETALAGTVMVEVARTLGWSDLGLPAAEAAGRLDVEAMRAAVPRLDTVVTRLREAAAALEAAGGDGLLGPVAAGYRDAVQRLTTRADRAARLRDALRLFPTMFGADGTRRYLVVVPALGVARPDGGAPVSVGTLVARAGRVRVRSLAGSRGGLSPAPRAIEAVESSPDGPTVGRRLLDAAAASGAPDLDGVVWLDPVALERLVWVTGDVRVPAQRLALSDATTTTALEIDAYLGAQSRVAARLRSEWATRVLEAFLVRRPGLESFALAAASAARERHLGVHLVRRDEQQLVRALGLDRGVPPPEDGVLPLFATWSSAEDAHVGALVSSRIRHEIAIRSDGGARVHTEVTLDNRAGSEPASVLLGRGGIVPVGTFVADVGLLLPAGARRVEAETSRPSPIVIGEELGYPTVRGSISIRGGTSATLTVSYVVPDALAAGNGGARAVVRVLPQPTIDGISYSIRIGLPEGAAVTSASPALRPGPDALTFGGIRRGPIELVVRLAT